MLDDIFAIHNEVMATTPKGLTRYLDKVINWEARAICILGGRGVGKTTLMCQALLRDYPDISKGLYISADNIHVLSYGLFSMAVDYFKYGGEALYIDEVHKYPNWSQEIKNIIDTYKNKKIIFTSSSSVDLTKSKYDLSRRVLYYHLKELSFREYLAFKKIKQFKPFTLDEVISQHNKLTQQFSGLVILKHFNDYLKNGCYPFFLEGTEDYKSRLLNVIEKALFEDIAFVYNLKQPTIIILKKLLWLISSSKVLVPNIDKISKNLETNRDTIYNSLEYLNQAGLIKNCYPNAKGMKLIRKPGKIFMENTNILNAIAGDIKVENDIGCLRETFFVNQTTCTQTLHLHDAGDFLLNNQYVIEVGGKSKNLKQIANVENSYLAIDGIETGFERRIPLYLFGMLY